MFALSVVSVLVGAAVVLGWALPTFFDGPGVGDILDGESLGTSDASAPVSGAPFSMVLPDDPSRITIDDASFYGWALLDRGTGKTTGSANRETETNTTESMIKPWIVADFLRQRSDEAQDPSPDELDELTLVLIDSNDPLAEKYYQLGGADEVVERLESICGLTHLSIESTLWGMTQMTPADAVRYGACLADGRAAGPQWTKWLLDTMKQVRGSVSEQDSGEVQGGRWGIIDGLPDALAKDTSFKNGWTVYDDGWHVNCLAIHPGWVLSVMMRTQAELEQAAAGCASVASSLVMEH